MTPIPFLTMADFRALRGASGVMCKAISHHGFITSTTSVHDLFKFFIGFPDQIFRVVHCLWGNIYQTPLCKLEIYARENGILIYSLFAVKQNLNQFCLKLRNVIVVYQISLFMVIIYYTGVL